MRRFGSDNMKSMMERLGMDDSQPIQSKMVSKAVESSQTRGRQQLRCTEAVASI